MGDFFGRNESMDNWYPNHRLRLKGTPLHEVFHVKCDTLWIPTRSKSSAARFSDPIVPVLKAASDSWVNIKFSTNKGYVFLQMVRNLHESVDQCLQSFFIHGLFGTACSSKEVSILLFQLCATECNETNFHTKNWDSSFSFGVKDREKPV